MGRECHIVDYAKLNNGSPTPRVGMLLATLPICTTVSVFEDTGDYKEPEFLGKHDVLHFPTKYEDYFCLRFAARGVNKVEVIIYKPEV